MSTTVTKVGSDIIGAMKAKDAFKTTTLRLVKSALQSKAIEKRADLEESEAQAILATMVKQRKDSIDQFTKGGRPELAEKEAQEIKLLEQYMPLELTDRVQIQEVVYTLVGFVTAELGRTPNIKDMGTVMKAAKVWTDTNNTRIDGKVLSDIVRTSLT